MKLIAGPPEPLLEGPIFGSHPCCILPEKLQAFDRSRVRRWVLQDLHGAAIETPDERRVFFGIFTVHLDDHVQPAVGMPAGSVHLYGAIERAWNDRLED